MQKKNRRLINILIVMILCVSSLDIITKSSDLSTFFKSVQLDSINIHHYCDETRLYPCSSSVFIAIFQSLNYLPNLLSHAKLEKFKVDYESILLEVLKRPPR